MLEIKAQQKNNNKIFQSFETKVLVSYVFHFEQAACTYKCEEQHLRFVFQSYQCTTYHHLLDSEGGLSTSLKLFKISTTVQFPGRGHIDHLKQQHLSTPSKKVKVKLIHSVTTISFFSKVGMQQQQQMMLCTLQLQLYSIQVVF